MIRDEDLLAPFDLEFAAAVGRVTSETNEAVLLAAAVASRQVRRGHVCADLKRLAAELPCPDLPAWLGQLERSPAQGEAGPLVLDGDGRLYLKRYWDLETSLAADLRARAERRPSYQPGRLESCLSRLFPGAPDDDAQRQAARAAVASCLCVVSGGPGTGKTATVVRILAAIAEDALSQGQPAPRIMMLAPTGKAAARLSESVTRALASLNWPAAIADVIPREAATIHRGLGLGGTHRGARFDRTNPLPVDVMVVDEASMVDLALMARLTAALPPEARLVLLGDEHQLASVEAGAILGDICAAPPPAPLATGAQLPLTFAATAWPLRSSIVRLEKSYRYPAGSGIAVLADAIRAGRAGDALAVLRDPARDDVQLVEGPGGLTSTDFSAAVVRGYVPTLFAGDPAQRLRDLERFRVLCAHRRGPRGVTEVNRLIFDLLRHHGLVPTDEGTFSPRPVLVERNDYALGLYNGDVGLVLAEPAGERPRAFFPALDGGVRAISPGRLPPHDTVFAMSVHKSQGSEFDEIAVVLPRQPSRATSRELLYTAVTRARARVLVVGEAEVVQHAIEHRVSRASGLAGRLHGNP